MVYKIYGLGSRLQRVGRCVKISVDGSVVYSSIVLTWIIFFPLFASVVVTVYLLEG